MPQMKTIQLCLKTLSDQLLDLQDNEIILGGDFNLVLDIEKDKQGGLAKTHQNAKKYCLWHMRKS